jgi:hypothetical protein
MENIIEKIKLLVFIVLIYLSIYAFIHTKNKKKFSKYSKLSNLELLQKHRTEVHFPYRYLQDEKNNMLPIVLVSAFFRDPNERDLFFEYRRRDIKVVGITAYKSFPRPILDNSPDKIYNEGFDYLKNIKNWFSCFKNKSYYGFDTRHNIIDYSESDFYDIDESPALEKKYDLIYVCFNDNDSCSMNGWNAINRNYKLALACFPIIMNEFKLKMLVIGRMDCGLKELYGDYIELLDYMPYHEFQDKLRESRCLFIPNIYDASPRTVAEALIKDVPVLMNMNIVCGSKYINYETGEFFTDEHDIRLSLKTLLDKKDKISPRKWWKENHSKKQAGKKFRDFLNEQYPEILNEVNEVYFA